MDLQLTNRKALVTGSTAGIGFAIASLLAQEGAAVVVNGRSQGRVEEAVRSIKKENKDAQAFYAACGAKRAERAQVSPPGSPTCAMVLNRQTRLPVAASKALMKQPCRSSSFL